MERLEPQVRRELGRFGLPEGDIVELVRAWPDAVGETVARNAWPARLARDGTLHVNATSSTWAFELGRMADEILARLRSTVGEAAPPALRFAPGPVPAPPSATAAEAPSPAPEVRPEDVSRGASVAAGIEDDDLRGMVARTVAAGLARARSEGRSGRRF